MRAAKYHNPASLYVCAWSANSSESFLGSRNIVNIVYSICSREEYGGNNSTFGGGWQKHEMCEDDEMTAHGRRKVLDENNFIITSIGDPS